MTIFLFVVGLALLVIGAEMLVRGASQIALRLGVPPLIIGLTVVAFGTSAPELAVSFKSAITGQAGIAVGNVVGSNIFNVLFILGLSAIIAPLLVSAQLIRFDVPLMIVASIIAYFLACDGILSFLDGCLLASGLVIYTGLLVHFSRRAKPGEMGEAVRSDVSDPLPAPRSHWLMNWVLVGIGLALLILGSRWFTNSSIQMAQWMGISDLVIGLTIVAAGTSFPELVTSVVASLRGERDIAVGNVVGSNIFNLAGVLGLTAIIAPSGVEVSPAAIALDIPVMVAVAVACLPIFFTGGIISRWEGVVLIAYYIAYTLYLVLAASQHAALPMFNFTMLYFLLPLTFVTLAVISGLTWRRKSSNSNSAAQP